MKPIAETKNFLWASNRFITLVKFKKTIYNNIQTWQQNWIAVLLFFAPSSPYVWNTQCGVQDRLLAD